MESKCPSCSAGFKTPLACGDCGVLVQAVDDKTPFEIMGLEPTMGVDPKDLRKRLRQFTRLVHPDFFTGEGEETRALAEAHNARLNEAYQILKDDARRADFLVRHLGGPTEKDLGAMPQEFLLEVMEWNEVLEEEEPGSEPLQALGEELEARRAQLLGRLEQLLTPLPPVGDPALTEARKALNALRYVNRGLSHVAGERDI